MQCHQRDQQHRILRRSLLEWHWEQLAATEASRAYAAKTVPLLNTPQWAPLQGRDQVPNSAGGFSFKIAAWQRLERFLILGCGSGSYYVQEQSLTLENAESVIACLHEDATRLVRRIVAVSLSGRAPRNTPALYALALVATHGDQDSRRFALSILSQVARTATHLFQFVGFVRQFRGWGRILSRGIRDWYASRTLPQLTYQMVKYRRREGWTHRDLLRLTHPRTADPARNALYRWATREEVGSDTPALVQAFVRAPGISELSARQSLIVDQGLTWEMVPTDWLNAAGVWEALLESMPLIAMVRNLAKMTAVGLLTPGAKATRQVQARLEQDEQLRAARLHPLALIMAQRTYAQGQGLRGTLLWTPVETLVDALDGAFYRAFSQVEPTGQRWYLALDVSGSMDSPLAGSALTCAEASAAMAMVTTQSESHTTVMAFSHHLIPLTIHHSDRLEQVLHATRAINFGATDCALPMLDAAARRLPVDVFVVYTDSETWFGNIHPLQALENYRQVMGIQAKLIVCGMNSNGFSIADPNDVGMLDLVGFDAAAPALMADFARDPLPSQYDAEFAS